VALVLLLEKVDAMALAAMTAGDEEVSIGTARERFWEHLMEPLTAGVPLEDSELRQAVGLGA
jgi:hypothetical protein